MEHITFSIRLPKSLYDSLEKEALNNNRNRTQQIAQILTERYQAHSPPVSPIHISKSRNGHKTNRKTKAEIN